MTASDIIYGLLIVNLAGSAAIVAVLALRGVIRRVAGAQVAYLSWLAVPAAVAACLVPARIVTIEAPAPLPGASISAPAPASLPSTPSYAPLAPLIEPAPAPVESALPPPSSPAPVQGIDIDWMLALALVWSAVAIAALIFLLIRERLAVRALGPLTHVSRKVFRAAESAVGPAVVGVFAPRIVLPANFEAAFEDAERKVVIAHEEAHLSGRHTAVKAFVEIAVCLNWFNPLAYLAARTVAMDQELACDEAVVRRYPEHRKAYAGVLLKNQAGPRAPLGCYWPASSARGLKTRITEIQRGAFSRKSRAIGGAVLVLMAAVVASAAWASKPPQTRLVVAQSAHELDPPLQPETDQARTTEQQTPPPPAAFAQDAQGPSPAPFKWDEPPPQDVPAGFDAQDPVYLRGRVEKIDFSDTKYVVFVRALSIAPSRNGVATTNNRLWELSPTPFWGDRDAVSKDLMERDVHASGFNAVDKSCSPNCRMLVRDFIVPRSTTLPPLVSGRTFSVVDVATSYNIGSAPNVRGAVERIEFGDRMFDIYLRTAARGPIPGILYQVRSEYRFPPAEIERLLLNQTIAVAGWPAKADVICEPACGLYGTDFELPDLKRLTPSGEALVADPLPELRSYDPDRPPAVFHGFAHRDATFDPNAIVTIEGKVLRVETDNRENMRVMWIEASSFNPAAFPGATPGTVWRVEGEAIMRANIPGNVKSWPGMTATVRGFNARDKSCQPECFMSASTLWVRPN